MAHTGLMVACEMASPVASQPATSTFKGSPRPRMCAGSPRNSPMETSLPSRGAFGNATCRTDGGDRALRTEALRFDQHNAEP
jgi:hypothetical protein